MNPGDAFANVHPHVFGMPLHYSNLCLEKTSVPKRPYRRRRWQSPAQFQRKAKKWLKRYGVEMKPCIFQTPLGIFAHPSLKEPIESALARQSIIDSYRNIKPDWRMTA